MEKEIRFQSVSDRGVFCYLIDNEQPFLIKTAAEYHPTIASYINSAKPIPGKTQILLTALGAGEYWMNNVNGDYFTEEDLAHDGEDYGHKTFEKFAKIYKHHINKDPTKSYGDVALAVYNPKFHRVELIVVLDNEKSPDLVERINNGDYPEWSMGCRVKYDICSICGNKAPTRAQYCEHLKYYMGRIHPATGKMVYAINPRPVFFDISQVLIGADKTAKTLMKVASVKGASEYKHAEIEKEIPTNGPPASVEDVLTAIPEVKAREIPFDKGLLNNLAEKQTLPKILSTMLGLGMFPKPREFQRIILVRSGMGGLADELDSRNMHFDPDMETAIGPVHDNMVGISPDNFDDSIAKMLLPQMANRSYAKPHLVNRIIIMSKTASAPEYDTDAIKLGSDESIYPKINVNRPNDERKPVPLPVLMALIAGAYSAIANPIKATSVIGKAMTHPLVMASLGLAAPTIFNHLTEPRSKGNSDPSTIGHQEPEIMNMLEHIEQQKQQPLLKVGMSRPAVGAALAFGAPGLAYMMSNRLNKSMTEQPDYSEGKIKKFIRKYPEIVGAIGAVEGLQTLRDKPGMLNYALKAKDFMRGLSKTASAGDFLVDSMVWPLAMGGAHLPSRIVSSMLDQAVFTGSKKLLSKKQDHNTIR